MPGGETGSKPVKEVEFFFHFRDVSRKQTVMYLHFLSLLLKKAFLAKILISIRYC